MYDTPVEMVAFVENIKLSWFIKPQTGDPYSRDFFISSNFKTTASIEFVLLLG